MRLPQVSTGWNDAARRGIGGHNRALHLFRLQSPPFAVGIRRALQPESGIFPCHFPQDMVCYKHTFIWRPAMDYIIYIGVRELV